MNAFVRLLTTTAILGLVAFSAEAQYPVKPIRIVVGFTPGGAADVVTRVVAQGLSKQLGQQVVVENKPGADSAIAAEAVATSTPDGYTLFLGTNSAMVAVPTIRPNTIRYDPFRDFTPISSIGRFTMFLVVNPKVPANTAAELMEQIRAHPGKLSYGTSNSAAELAMAQLLSGRMDAMVHVRYKGDTAALTDLMNDQIQVMFATGTSAPAFVKDGKLRALATLREEKSPLLPDVPTAAEAGLQRLTIVPWAALFGPARMPAEITARLSEEVKSVLRRQDVREQLEQQGFEAAGSTPEELAAFFKTQAETWKKTVHEHGIKFE
jgi:tripartite-type tricarboxylate transporter receptor subunit TctC